MSRVPEAILAATARSLCGLASSGSARQEQLEDLARMLARLDLEDVHRLLPASSWGVDTVGDGAWRGLSLTDCSLAGLTLVRGDTTEIALLMEHHAVDFTKPALRVAAPALGKPRDVSGTAYLVASANPQVCTWWTYTVQLYPEKRPRVPWDATPDLQLGMTLRPWLSEKDQRANVFNGVATLLLAASRVDLQWLASLSLVPAPNNPLLDVLTQATNVFGRGATMCSMNHLILGQDADILPGPGQSSLLHAYVRINHPKACLELLEAGHPLDLRDESGRTPVDLARQCKSVTEGVLVSWQARSAAAGALRDSWAAPAA